MDPLFDYYLCTKDGDVELWMAFGEDVDALPSYDSVCKLAFWQAVQWDAALRVVERSSAEGDDLRALLAAALAGACGGAIGNSLPRGCGVRETA